MNLTSLLDAFIRAVEEAPATPDPVLERNLTEAGADVRTARRILVFAPMACCQVWFRDSPVSFAATYFLYGGGKSPPRALADEPVFVESLFAAERCDRFLLQTVAGRSSGYHSVNSLLEKRDGQPGAPNIRSGSPFLPSNHLEPADATPPEPWTTSDGGDTILLRTESEAVTARIAAMLVGRGVPTTSVAPTPWWKPWASAGPLTVTPRAMVRSFHPLPNQARLELRVELVSSWAAPAPAHPVRCSGENVAAAVNEGLTRFDQTVLVPYLARFESDTGT